MAFKTWFNPWIKGSEGITWGRREGGHMCVTKDGICKQFRPCIQKRVLSLFFSEKYKHPLVFIPQWASSSIPTKAEKWRKTGWSFLLGNDDSWTTQLTLLVPFSSPLRKKPNSHNFRNMSKSGVISLIDWKIKKVGLDLVDYFFKDHPIEIDINPTESFFSNENIP